MGKISIVDGRSFGRGIRLNAFRGFRQKGSGIFLNLPNC